ncbi:hypothetical protein DFH08DRAFT_1051912 [Mycena albidolilacea]|uniref:DUF4100 domain-containing protein n=1 Tax=Mycena albidolilacea TaxID=1033008 RepID=A0AAD7EX71_9AGAR|nr:hypothetical protein DFH08DRAFT_1051912 [Mycena albidolilacea]
MPIAGTANAPHFNGKYLTDFLTVLVQHGANAGITDLDRLVPYILQYSSDEVKDLIRYLPEFDPDEPNKTFPAAKTQLRLLYSQGDEPPSYTETMLRDFCRDQSAKSPFKNKVQIETYLKDFMGIAGPLVKQKKITSQLRDYYFITGLPSVIKEWFNNQVPEANHKRSDPPAIAVSVGILQKRFDADSLLFEPWKDENESSNRKVRFDTDGKRVETAGHQNTRPSTPNATTVPQAPKTAANTVEDLTKLLENLSLNLALLNSTNQSQSAPTNPGVTGTGTSTNTGSFQRRCFMCGQSGTHPLHPSKCPEAKTLLDNGLIKFDTIRERFTMLDGNEFPRVPNGFIGGVADYIRAQARDQAQAQNAARSNSIGLSYGNERVLKGDVFAVSSIGPQEYYADPVTRSGKDTNRHDPISKDKGKKKQVHLDTPQRMPPTQAVPGPSKPKENTIPVPPHPINRPEGWKESLPSNQKQRDDVVMKDATKKEEKSTPSYHFTSDIQEMADPKLVLQKIFEQNVSVPIFQLIGSSPSLQKLVGEATRVRREYSAKSAEYSFHDSDDFEEDVYEVVTAAHTEVINNQRQAYVGGSDGLDEFLTRYSNAVARVPEKRFFAMTTGAMTVTIGGAEFSAMIDCGSELNLAGKSVPMRASLPVDFEGMKWSLKGVHGGPEQLQGCSTDVPMRIGRHEFAHHLFVSHQELGQHDIILGQPFLQWFASRIDYERNGAVSLYLWKEGDRKMRPTVVISITDPSDPRNTTTITTRGHSSARVEEVSDEEDF